MTGKTTAAELAKKYDAIQDRSDYPAIEAYGDVWDKASLPAKGRFLFGLYSTK